MGEGNIARLLAAGTTEIHINPEAESDRCAVIPAGKPAVVSSRGLRWDMGACCLPGPLPCCTVSKRCCRPSPA